MNICHITTCRVRLELHTHITEKQQRLFPRPGGSQLSDFLIYLIRAISEIANMEIIARISPCKISCHELFHVRSNMI